MRSSILLSVFLTFLSFTSISALIDSDWYSTGDLGTEVNTNVVLDKFDQALGTLTGIKITIFGNATSTIRLTNSGVAPIDEIAGTVQCAIRLDSTIRTATLGTPGVVRRDTYVTLAGGTDPVTVPAQSFVNSPPIEVANNGFFSVSYNSGANAAFVGNTGDEISLLLTTFTTIGSNGGNDISPTGTTFINVNATIEYTYTAAVSGDPQFAGFQGQQFQFHGLPDTVFNLVSAPELQMNAQFVYIASGVCNYNGTACFSHPGTYLGQIGVAIGSQTFTLVSGPHSKGLRAFVQNGEDRHAMIVGAKFSFTTQHGVMSISHPTNGNVEIRSPNFSFNVVNSDSFFNLEAALLNTQLLHTGAKKHNIKHCKDTIATEASLMKHYPVKNYIHGLVGQTWRAVSFCDQPWQGVVGDYIASDLHANDYRFNFFNATE